MQAAICFEMLFPGLDPAEKIRKVAAAGFRWVEFWGWRDKDIPALIASCRKHGVGVANFSGHRRGSPVASETHPAFLSDLEEAAEVAGRLSCVTLMLLTNELGEEGRVIDSFPTIAPVDKRANVVKALRGALQVVPETIRLVLEPLNPRIDHPGYWLTDMASASALIEEIDNPRLRVLCDLYHLGVNGDDLRGVIRRYAAAIGHVHVADFPGRHEPGTGSADWLSLLTLLGEQGYDGFVGFEYAPAGDSERSLQAIRALWDRLVY
jgi:hydroxypyruvate isomerase